jgi:hypothetical protein
MAVPVLYNMAARKQAPKAAGGRSVAAEVPSIRAAIPCPSPARGEGARRHSARRFTLEAAESPAILSNILPHAAKTNTPPGPFAGFPESPDHLAGDKVE